MTVMTADAFRELAIALRDAGACKVRVGDWEVIWGGPVAPSRAAIEGLTRRSSDADKDKGLTPEQQRLREYQRELSGEG